MTPPTMVRGVLCTTPDEVVERWTPAETLLGAQAWTHAQSLIQDAVRAAGFASPDGARSALRAVSGLVAWALDNDMVLDVETLMTPDNIDRYVATRSALSVRSRATYRSFLRRVGRAATRQAPWPAYPESYSPSVSGSPPYTAAQVRRYLEVAEAQANERRRHAMRVVLTLGLGTGVTTTDMVRATAADVFDHPTAGVLCLQVPGRLVPVRVRYVDRLRSLCQARPDGPLVGPETAARDRLSRYLNAIELPPDLPALHIRRLRNTWAVAVLDGGATIAEFKRLAGTTSAKTIDLLSTYVQCRTTNDEYLRIASRA